MNVRMYTHINVECMNRHVTIATSNMCFKHVQDVVVTQLLERNTCVYMCIHVYMYTYMKTYIYTCAYTHNYSYTTKKMNTHTENYT